MNGVSRFLSRRDKHHKDRQSKHGRNKSQQVSTDLYTIFTNEEVKQNEKDDEKKVNTLLQRLKAAGFTNFGEAQVHYALQMYPNDLEKAYDVLVLANDSFEGILKPFDPQVKMLGAINRNMVTCYLDALLFAMFARLDSFEAMLYDNFSDEPRKRLAVILRLWVNLLRTGRLIQVDLTKHLQETLAKCGWEGAAEVCQQDASEAFTFITGALELPLLTLKMDIYHTGREDKEDDHKFVNERLLEVAIPEQEGDKVITLENCLETYFNNRIEVKRYLQRHNTLTSISSDRDMEKNQVVHIEAVEVSSPDSPLVTTPTSLTPVATSRPLEGRRRGDSIFSERFRLDKKPFDEKRLLDEMLNDNPGGRPRSASLRKEVLMPAWQFFSLIPWYTDNVPQTDAQVAAHFAQQRPVLGICLKRYMMLPNGTPKRLDTYIDIPLEIGLPHFISDDRMQEEGPLFGNFKLVLQSVVCHRGVSVDSGHYISLVRANLPPTKKRRDSPQSQSMETSDSWLRFDDLAPERVIHVNIKEALEQESPYLLFYQVQPIDEELASRGDPPTYAESQGGHIPSAPSRETLGSVTETTNTDIEGGDWDRVTAADLSHLNSLTSDGPTGRSSMSSNRRSSVTFDIEELEASVTNLSRGRTAPSTPAEEKFSFLSASRRNSKARGSSGHKSRPSSQNGENRLSLTLSRLTGRGSKDRLQIPENNNVSEDPVIVINEVQASGSTEVSTESSTQDLIKESENEKNGHGSGQSIPHPHVRGGSGGIGRSKSKRDKGKEKEEKKKRSKSKEPGELYNRTGRPDRECVVM